jgi:DNA end-binding protein Ku
MLFPATTNSEKVRFNLINRKSGNRIHLQKVDAVTGDVVDDDDIVKGYKSGEGYVEITEKDFGAIEAESSHTIDIDQSVPRAEIDDLYINRPYYIGPDRKVGVQAFAVIREAIKKKGVVGIGQLVLSTREHVIALEPRDAGILGVLLHYPYELRKPEKYFADIQRVETPKEMIDLATHIIDTMAGHFDPQRFENRYKVAMREVIRRKQAGEKIIPADHAKPMTIKLIDALRASLGQRPPAASSVRRRSAPVLGKKPIKAKRGMSDGIRRHSKPIFRSC